MVPLVSALVLVGLMAGPAAAQIYHWSAPGGVVQYYTTDLERIPLEYRETAQIIYSTPRGVLSASGDSSLPSEGVTPAGESSPDAGDGGAPSAGGGGAKLVSRGGVLMVGAKLNGVPLTLLVDTGASKTMISPAALSRAGLDSSGGQPVGVVGVTGVGDGFEVTVPRLDVAGTQVGPLAVVAQEVPGAGAGADGLLGRDILSGFILMIDVSRSRVTLIR